MTAQGLLKKLLRRGSPLELRYKNPAVLPLSARQSLLGALALIAASPHAAIHAYHPDPMLDGDDPLPSHIARAMDAVGAEAQIADDLAKLVELGFLTITDHHVLAIDLDSHRSNDGNGGGRRAKGESGVQTKDRRSQAKRDRADEIRRLQTTFMLPVQGTAEPFGKPLRGTALYTALRGRFSVVADADGSSRSEPFESPGLTYAGAFPESVVVAEEIPTATATAEPQAAGAREADRPPHATVSAPPQSGFENRNRPQEPSVDDVRRLADLAIRTWAFTGRHADEARPIIASYFEAGFSPADVEEAIRSHSSTQVNSAKFLKQALHKRRAEQVDAGVLPSSTGRTLHPRVLAEPAWSSEDLGLRTAMSVFMEMLEATEQADARKKLSFGQAIDRSGRAWSLCCRRYPELEALERWYDGEERPVPVPAPLAARAA